TVRQGLRPILEGRRIVRLETFRPDLRIPFPNGLAERVMNRTVQRIDRRSKYLLMRLGSDSACDGGDVVILHLGMSGSIRILPRPAAPREAHDQLELATDAGVVVRFHDPRRFGLVALAAADALEGHRLLAGLGPEPLDPAFDGPALAARLKGKRTSIK